MRIVSWVCLMLLVCLPGPLWSQQLPLPTGAECQAELTQALARFGTQTTLHTQDREAIVRYFQSELQKGAQERAELKKQMEQLKHGQPQPPEAKRSGEQ